MDGVLVLDLPIEEAGDFRALLAARGVDTILLLSPTTTRRPPAQGGGPRAAEFLSRFPGSVSPACADQLAEGAEAIVAPHPRGDTTLPVALGFGISKPDHVA